MIRKATMADVTALVGLGFKFHELAKVDKYFSLDPIFLGQNLRRMLREPNKNAIMVIDLPKDGIVGTAGFVISQNFFSRVDSIAAEQFYWILPEHRGKFGSDLLKALEVEAKALQATHIAMAALNASNIDKVEAIYDKHGYAPMERRYIKKI
jgi:RimJ/RimL family protein N-acetyltransferase